MRHSSELLDPLNARPRHSTVTEGGTVIDSLEGLVGRTPLVRITAPTPFGHHGFWAKLEGHNPGGMKGRSALSMLLRARERGTLKPGATIVESTSGTLGLALAFAGITLGHPVILVVDNDIEPMMVALLKAYGARLDVVTVPHSSGGWQEARRQRVAALLAQDSDAFWPDQYNNQDNPDGYRSLADELIQQFTDLDTLVCSVGTGGHSAGVGRRLKQHWPHLRIVGVDSVASTLFGQPAGKRLMRGLGSSIYPRNVDYSVFDEVHWIGPSESVQTCRALARGAFVTGGWSTGAVTLVSSWYSRRFPGAQICTIFPDSPYRYWDTIFNDEYCHRNGLLTQLVPHDPIPVDGRSGKPVERWSHSSDIHDPAPLDTAMEA